MAISDELGRLSVRAKQAEERAAAAKTQAREQLAQAVQTARDSIQHTTGRLRTDSAAGAGRADAWADNMQHSWNEHLAQARARHDDRTARHAADRAESDAEDAEGYASSSIEFAYSAIEETGYAVLDAFLAREDADWAAQTVST